MRYLAGEAGPEEAMALQEAMQHQGFQARFKEFEEVWIATHPGKKIRDPQPANAWNKINQRMSGSPSVPSSQSRIELRPNRSLVWKIAASVLLIALSSFLIYLTVRERNTPSAITISTIDSVKVFEFPDHSQVTLYHNTAVVHPQKFDEGTREIQLVRGEAFFSIEPDRTKPFIIHTSLADI
ncbi:MAG TPA: FecR family protein, partial [Blastocatellia bacterium]|nr:FecR family protein [Blastocatellia bacterium]